MLCQESYAAMVAEVLAGRETTALAGRWTRRETKVPSRTINKRRRRKMALHELCPSSVLSQRSYILRFQPRPFPFTLLFACKYKYKVELGACARDNCDVAKWAGLADKDEFESEVGCC